MIFHSRTILWCCITLKNYQISSNILQKKKKSHVQTCLHPIFLSNVPKKKMILSTYLFQFSNITISQDIFDYLEAKSLKEASLDEKSKRLCILHTVKVMSNNTNIIFLYRFYYSIHVQFIVVSPNKN